MGRIATLAERALAKAGSIIEKVVPEDPDKAEWLGEKIEKIFGKKVLDKIEDFAEAADEANSNRRLQKETDPARRAMMLGAEHRERVAEAAELAAFHRRIEKEQHPARRAVLMSTPIGSSRHFDRGRDRGGRV